VCPNGGGGGAKPGDMFEEDFEENEDFDNESYHI